MAKHLLTDRDVRNAKPNKDKAYRLYDGEGLVLQVTPGEHLTVLKRVEKAKKRAARANTFAAVKEAWLPSEGRRQKWTPGYRAEVESSLRNHASDLDALPITTLSVEPALVMDVLR